MTNFEKPDPFDHYTDKELDAQIERVEANLFDLEIEALETGRATPDELAEETLRIREQLGYRPKDWED